MADQVAEIKSKVDIVNVVGARVKLVPAGKYMKGLCPFHSERTPSFFVSSELQVFKCFGCGKSGDVFSFLEEYEGLTFREALEVLAEKTGVKLERYRPTQGEADTKRMYEVLSLAAEYYAYVLTKHPAGLVAREYLASREIGEGLVGKFELGWAPDTWDGLSKYLMGKKKYSFEELESVGLAGRSRSGRIYDRFRGRVMFPLHDFRGRVVGFSGRLLEEREREGKYINTAETKLYHKRELLYGLSVARGMIRKKDMVYVVEGEFDVISSYKAGVMNVVGIKGTALTKEQVGLLLRLTRNVTLCLDADVAGDEAMKRGIEVADKLGMNVSVVEVEGGKDPDEVVKGDPKAWKKMVKKAVSVYEYLIESAVKRYGVDTGLGKKKVMEEVGLVLSKITNKVEQAHYIGVVAKRLKVGNEVVESEMERAVRKEEVGGREVEREDKEDEDEGGRGERLERYVWGLLMQLSGKEFEQAWKKMEGLEWVGRGYRRLAEDLGEFVERNKGKFEMKQFVKGLAPELAGLVSRVYLNQEMVDMVNKGEIEEELERARRELGKMQTKAKMKELTEEIATLEGLDELSQEEKNRLREIQEEFSRLAVGLGK